MNNIIETFYKAFNDLDAETMVDCYHDDIVFEDPAFGILKGNRAKNMWRMLCHSQKGKDFKITFSNVNSNENSGIAHWEAFYTFSKSNRKVHNKIEARFEFQDGKIIRHTDVFNLNNWAKQALGTFAYWYSFTLFFKKQLNEKSNKALTSFEKKNSY